MIQFINVYKSYREGVPSLSDVTFRIKKGEFVSIVGRSGSGKTTILKLIYCEESPSRGRIVLSGKNIEKIKRSEIPYIRRSMGIIFQDFRLIEGKSIFENVAVPLEVLGVSGKETVERVGKVLETVRLRHRMEEDVSTLSEGEKQKVAVARAIINDPVVILADEPTGSLDGESGSEIIEILEEVNSRGVTVLLTGHDEPLRKRIRSIRLEKGKVRE